MMRPYLLGPACILVAALTLPAGAQPGVGVEIAPSRLERDLTGRSVSVKMLVVNHDADPRRVRLTATGLGHDLEGAPQLLDPSPAARAVRLGVSEFTLEGGGRREFEAAATIPRGRPALYAGVVAEFGPLTPPAGAVEARTRVASLLLLRGPRPWRESIAVTEVGLLPSERGQPLRVYANVKNTGNVHQAPRGRIRVLLDGDEIHSVDLTGGTVLPGYTRRFTGEWTPGDVPGPGQVTLLAVFTNPVAEGSARIDLRTGGAGEPAVEIRDLRGEVDAAGPVVRLHVVNTGPVTVEPIVTLTASEEIFERARKVLPQGSMRPGESKPIEWRPTLTEGLYEVRARAEVGERLLDEKVIALGLAAKKPAGGRGSSVLPLVAGVLGLAILGLVVALVLALRRRGSRDLQPAARDARAEDPSRRG